MIETREQLIHMLTEAAEIEHNLLCSYLYAAFSLKREGEPGLTGRQAEAVERWRKAVLGIALEEMAHLACVNNLLIAVGGAPHFDRPNFPVAPGYHPADIVVRLTPFDEATLDHFIYLERPEGMKLADGGGFDPVGTERRTVVEGLTPSAQDYATVGALYDAIGAGLEHLSARLGEALLIDPAGRSQLSSEQIRLANIPKVTDLSSALGTIAQIKEEGEGSQGGARSHFERFVAIKREWAELAQNDPAFRPAWPAASDPVMRKPLDESARLWVTEPRAARHLDLANAIYGAMLGALAQAFGGAEPADQETLLRASVELMEACAAVAVALARMPANPDHPGINAGMTFAVPRNAAHRPLTSQARMIFAERVAELQAGAAGLLDGAAAEKVERRLGNAAALFEG
jgi:hypothetical protein